MGARYFVTGTDTDCGKTTVAAGLLHAARLAGLSTAAVKPVASGCLAGPDGLRNADALALLGECSLPLSYAQVNPFAFLPAIAPHVAAQESGQQLTVDALADAVRSVLELGAELTIVEGAGGWRVPLGQGVNLSELPRALGLPVILVVGVRLGCINHAYLSAEAIQRDGLQLAGWVANIVDPQMSRRDDTLRTLTEGLQAPCLGTVPNLAQASPAAVAAHLQLAPLGLAI